MPGARRLLALVAVAGLLQSSICQLYAVTLTVNTTVTGRTHDSAGVNLGHNWVRVLS